MFYSGCVVLRDIAAPGADATAAVGSGCHQRSLFASGELEFPRIRASWQQLDRRSAVLYEPGWVQGSEPLFDRLVGEMPWRSVERPMYDRIVAVPRLICTVDPTDLETEHPLARTSRAVCAALGMSSGPIGLNLYRNGGDSVAWHRDRLGAARASSTVALVSLGSPRTLALRPYRGATAPPAAALPAEPEAHRTDGSTTGARASRASSATATTGATARRWRLGHGDLLVMSGACQLDWEHCVPKERAVGPRISLAFRCRTPARGPRKAPSGVPPWWASHNLQ